MKPTLPTCLARQMTTRLVLFTLLLLGIGQMKGFAQEIFRYTNDTGGAHSYIDPNADNALPVLGRGAGVSSLNLACGGPMQGFGATHWPTTNVFNVGTFNAAGEYIEFTLTPNGGYGLNITGFSARSRRENLSGTADDGPIAIRYGFSTNGPGGPWTTVNPGNPQSSNLCASGGVNRVWPSWDDTLTSNPIIFRIYGLSSGANLTGDLFLRDVVVYGTVCANDPTITPAPDFFELCYGQTSVDYEYSAEEADTYSIDYDDPAFTDIPAGTALPDAPGTISLTIPANTAPGSYTGTLTVSNSCGFSTDYGFTIQVHALPDVTIEVSPIEICAGEDITLSFTDNAATGDLFTIVADLVDDNGTSVGEINFSGIPSGASVVYTEGVDFDGDVTGTVSLTNIVVTNETTECVNDTEADVTLTVNALPEVTCPDDFEVCIDGFIFLEGLPGLTPPSVDANSSFSGPGVTPFDISLGLWDFSPSSAGLGTHTITYTYTDGNGCINECTFDITVNAIPDIYAEDKSICSGNDTEVEVTNPNYVGGTFNWVATYNGVTGGAGSATGVAYGVDAINETLVNPTDLPIVVQYTLTPFGPDPTYCDGSFFDIFITVDPAPVFEFSAASEGDGPHFGNNGSGPNTLDVDFCAGQHLTLDAYEDNGDVGYTVSYTTTGNVTYDGGGPLPLISGPSNVAPGAAAGFFGEFGPVVYGGVLGYGLSLGTSGTINQVFVPYLDNDASGDLSPGDCEGAPMYLNYYIHAIPTVTVSPSTDIELCHGTASVITFSGNYGSGVEYLWDNDNTDIGIGTDGNGNITFTATNTTDAPIVGNLTVTPSTDYCEGDPVSFTVTVYPAVVVSVTATVAGGDDQTVSNFADPNTIVLDFCAGESFTYSGFDAPLGVGFIEEIVDGTTNLLYGFPIMTPILPIPRPPTNITPAGAAAFFGGTYGPYNLASGTYGWMTETFTPYYDANGDGDYDALTDCLGKPITITYRIYAPISLSITRNNPLEICSGDAVDYTFSTTSTELVSFDLVLEENSNAGNPADLDDDNTLPVTLVGVTFNSANPYNFNIANNPLEVIINNAVGSFDRGRVRVRAINIAYADADVCTTADVNGTNTQVYPMPRLEEVDPLLTCDGSLFELDIELQGLPSMNSPTAGYDVGIEWTIIGSSNAVGFSNSIMPVSIHDGTIDISIADIAQNLSLINPSIPGTVTYEITPRSMGPGGGYNGNDCYGDPITVEVTVVPAAEPTISGPTCVHVGAQIQLTADNDVELPATFVSGEWDATPNVTLTPPLDLDNVLVTGYVTGTATITYTVTDDAGCVSTAEYEVEVLEPLLLEHVYTGGPVACGEEFTVSVEVNNFCDINSLDYPFTWDASAFQLVTFNNPFQPAGGTFFSFTSGPGELYLGFADDGNTPYGNDLTDGTVVFTYTLRAVGSLGSYNLPDVVPTAEAYNSGFQLVPNETEGVSIPIELLALDLVGNPVICPSDPFIHLEFENVVGNPNYYVIDFDPLSSPPFPDIQQGTLVVLDGEILIPTPPGILNGSYNATLVVSNTTYGCESATYLFSIIVDQDPPTASNPDPVNVDCVASIPAPNINVVDDEDDDCPGEITVAYEPSLSSTTGTGCAGNPMIISRVYSVTDEAGNTTYVTQTITAEDNLPPYLLTPPVIGNWYQTEALAIAAATAHANLNKRDNCTPPIGITVTPGVPFGPLCNRTIPIMLFDACGILATFNYNVVIDGAAPTVTAGIIDDCYDEDETPTAPYYANDYAVQAAILATTATDDCDLSLTITASVSGTDCELFITVTATDDCNKSNSVTYTTRVENDAPIISSDPLTFEGACFDDELEAANAAIAATFAGDDCTSPGDLQIEAEVSLGCPAEITVFVTDFCGNFSTIVYTGVHIDTEDPQVDPDAIYATCFQTLEAAYDSLAKATHPYDNCTSDEEMLASVAVTNVVEVGDLEDECQEYDIELTFIDNCGNEVVYTYEFITIDNEAPTVEPLDDLEYTCLDDVEAEDIGIVEADDNCGVENIEHLSTTLPTSCPGTGTRTYRVYDCAGNYTDVTQNIIVNDDVKPTWNDPFNPGFPPPSDYLDRTISCEDLSSIAAALLLKPEAEDNCGEVTVTLTSSTPSSSCAGGYVRTWTAVDDCGNVVDAPFTQVITIIDNVAPEWVTLSGALDEEVECDDAVGLAAALATEPLADDNCGDVTYAIVYHEFEPNFECTYNSLGTWVTEWEATDDCGNTSISFFRYVNIYDNTPPEWDTYEGMPFPNGIDVTISCSDIAGYDFANSLEPEASDICDPEVNLIKTTGSFVPGGDCLGEGSFTNTWTAIDDCGNVSLIFTQTITVVDNTPPTFDPVCQFMPLNLFTSEGADCHEGISLSEGEMLDYLDSWTVAGVSILPLGGCIGDDCSPIESVIAEVVSITDVPGQTVEVTPEYTAECVRQITVSFQLRDACGNVQPTLFVCIYNIIDDNAPLASGYSIDDCYETEAEALAAAQAATTVSDNCTATPDLVVDVVRTGTLCAATITVTATDCAGNVSNPVIYNTRIDGEKPTMTVSDIADCFPDVATAQGAAIAGTTITDNCSAYGQMIITATTVGTCPATVTVTATDECGNSRSVAYPGLCIGAGSEVTIVPEASNLNVDCDTWQADLSAWLADHGGADALGTDIEWSYLPLDPQTALQMSAPNCTTHTKSVVVTFRATNDCGNFDETTATFSITDLVPPTANLIPNTNLTCSTGIPAPNVAIVTGESDNCGGTPTVAIYATSDNLAAGCPATPRIIIHQYMVTDAYCNTALVNHMITVVDNVPPNFTAPANITINVNAACVYNASTAITGDVLDESDNCTASGPMLQAFYTDVVNSGVNFQERYIITRTWQLTDACGNPAIPRVQTITVLDVTPPTLTGCSTDRILSGTLSGEDCGAMASPALAIPSFGDNCPDVVISYELTGATVGSGPGFVPVSTVFLEGVTTVTYTVTDAVGNTVTCSFTVTVNCLSIAGRIIWEHDDVTGVNNTTVNVTSAAPPFSGSDLSDIGGNYEVTVTIPNITYKVKPVKNTGGHAGRMNGVDIDDANRILAHVNFSNPILDPYKKVCADVNRSNVINLADKTLIEQCILLNPDALLAFNVFWRFVPTDFQMPGTAHQNVPAFDDFKDVPVTTLDVVGINFFGMKIGDVADSPWADPSMSPSIPPLVWILQDQMLVAGTEVDLTFAASNFNNLAAYQFALDFDPTQLQFVGFQPLGAIPMNLLDNFGAYNADLGELRSVWTGGNGTTLADGTPVFRAKFKVLESGQKLSQVLRLDDSEIACRAYSEAHVPTAVKLLFTESVSTDTPLELGNMQLQLMQNRPNPFSDATTIGFILPEACEAHIRILDISGRELTSYDRQYTAGYHELEFRMENAWSYGVLFCELVTPQGKRTIKMMTAK